MKNTVFCFFLFIFPVFASGQAIIVELEGEINFGENSLLISEAGEDFSATPETSNPVFMAILYSDQLGGNLNPNQRWQVFIHKQDLEWNPELNLQVRRTGAGIKYGGGGNPQIRDGENYQEISNTPVYFFQGRGQNMQIPLSFKLTGVSVTLGARDFETSLIFTVYED